MGLLKTRTKDLGVRVEVKYQYIISTEDIGDGQTKLNAIEGAVFVKKFDTVSETKAEIKKTLSKIIKRRIAESQIQEVEQEEQFDPDTE